MTKRKLQKGQFISLPLLKLLHSLYILKSGKITTLSHEDEYKSEIEPIYTETPFIKEAARARAL